MDEILVSNFMVFDDLVEDEQFDLWIGDEAWDVDYFLHENPELKRTAYAWLTDFVGWLPMPDGGAAERALTTDYNAEMIEQIARFPRLRDRAIFVGNARRRGAGRLRRRAAADPRLGPAELPVLRLRVGLPAGGRPARAAIRAELGYRDGEKVCVVTVGGSGVGLDCSAGSSRPSRRRRLSPGCA